jgi:hypothetical protein
MLVGQQLFAGMDNRPVWIVSRIALTAFTLRAGKKLRNNVPSRRCVHRGWNMQPK